eukprot:UN11048
MHIQNPFQYVYETFLKTLLGCPFGGTCLQPVDYKFNKLANTLSILKMKLSIFFC